MERQLYTFNLTPAAREREAQRLRHMANRATRCRDFVPPGMTIEQYALRLERQAREMSARASFDATRN
jgi:hypothetical protein